MHRSAIIDNSHLKNTSGKGFDMKYLSNLFQLSPETCAPVINFADVNHPLTTTELLKKPLTLH